MTKKKETLTVNADLSDLFLDIGQGASNKSDMLPERSKNSADASLSPFESKTITQALAIVIRQMEATGHRSRTISDYRTHVNHFAETVGVSSIIEVNANHIYEWLSSMDVSNQTKLTRLKCLKAFLGRCFDNGWVETRFWRSINIKVDSPVKEGATERDVRLLLSLLDLGDFVQLRDAAAVLMIYQTGIRVGTLSQLENKHVDLDAKMLRIDGDIVKNHSQILLPFGNDLSKLLGVLMRQNDIIRREHKVRNQFVFVTRKGGKIVSSPSNNNIQKRLRIYANEYGLKNINPHALRRGFAKNLLDKGANIAVISKALGHSDIAVTSRYLHLDKEEVANNLRQYL